MLKVESIKKGIVIDHIRAGLGYQIFTDLKLDQVDYTTALIRNVPSKKLGKKDLIKIDNVVDLDFDMLGLLDPNITVVIIENEEVHEKVKLSLPKKVHGMLQCKNPRCISTVEKIDDITFYLVNDKTREYRCEYCDTPYYTHKS
ncbi:aspartate carbamoyltransferase regulatory subunit [Vallitaleaceae bacterium 9-2]